MANIQIVAFIGSSRPGNATSKALAITADELRRNSNITIDVIDPAELDLRAPGAQNPEVVKVLQEKVSAATGVILSTPEYHGSYSSVIKQLIEHLGFPSTLSAKPVALLGVAAGAIGAIKSLEHLRSVCSHVGAIVLPGPVSVAGVQNAFDDEGACIDPKVEKRLRGLAQNLTDYIHQNICPRVALEQMVREN